MNLLPRRIRPGLFLAILAFVLALPVTWSDRAPWQGIAPSLSHAGGSPDETLTPTPTPPQGAATTAPKRTAPSRRIASESSGRSVGAFGWSDLGKVDWQLVWKTYVATVLRF